MRTLSFLTAVLVTAGFAVGQQQFSPLARHGLPVERDATRDVDAGDVDGDGDADIVFANRGQNMLYLNRGFGDFTPSALSFRAVNSREIRLVDMDGDGDLDAVVGFTHYPGPDTDLLWFEAPDDPTRVWNDTSLASMDSVLPSSHLELVPRRIS